MEHGKDECQGFGPVLGLGLARLSAELVLLDHDLDWCYFGDVHCKYWW